MRVDLGPYYSDSQIKGGRYLIITPGDQSFVAGIVAEVPDLEMARKIIAALSAPVSPQAAPQEPYTPYAYEEVHRFYEKWPGGLDEIESSLKYFRWRIAELEAAPSHTDAPVKLFNEEGEHVADTYRDRAHFTATVEVKK